MVGDRKTVLIVEKRVAARAGLIDALYQAGFKVIAAASDDEAREILDLQEQVSVLVTECTETSSDFELVRKFSERDIAVILTGVPTTDVPPGVHLLSVPLHLPTLVYFLQVLTSEPTKKSLRYTPPGLSPRQAQVLSYLVRGDSNAEISRALSISVATVKLHVHHLFRALGVSNRWEAARVATRALDNDATPSPSQCPRPGRKGKDKGGEHQLAEGQPLSSKR